MESKSYFELTTNEQKKKTSDEKYLFYLFQVRTENALTTPAENRVREREKKKEKTGHDFVKILKTS